MRCSRTVVSAAVLGLISSLSTMSLHADGPSPLAREGQTLVDSLGKGFSLHLTPHFLLVHASPGEWASEVGKMLEGIHDRFYADFRKAGFEPKPLECELTWICFGSVKEYSRYSIQADRMDLSWMDGYYSARTNRVAMAGLLQLPTLPRLALQGASTLRQVVQNDEPVALADHLDLVRASHEAAHQLAFNSGLQKRRVMYPLWVSEGLATSFDADPGGRCGLDRPNPVRVERLQQAHGRHRLLSLDQFIHLTRVPDAYSGAADDCYAQCYGLFRFMLDQRGPQLRRYLAYLSNLEPGFRDVSTLRREFAKAFGPPAELEQAWQRYLVSLKKPEKPAPSATGASRPGLK